MTFMARSCPSQRLLTWLPKGLMEISQGQSQNMPSSLNGLSCSTARLLLTSSLLSVWGQSVHLKRPRYGCFISIEFVCCLNTCSSVIILIESSRKKLLDLPYPALFHKPLCCRLAGFADTFPDAQSTRHPTHVTTSTPSGITLCVSVLHHNAGGLVDACKGTATQHWVFLHAFQEFLLT